MGHPFLILLALAAWALLGAGCTTFAEHRAQAEQHWNEVRAGVKFQLASQQFERGQLDAAVATVQEAIAMNRTSAEQYLLLAHCYLEQGKLASARKAVVAAQACAPDSAEVPYSLGMIAEHEGDLAAALEHYRLAREREGENMDYLAAEAECMAALGQPEQALALVRENLGRFDPDGTLELLLSHICVLTGDEGTAVRHLRAALERSGCKTAMAAESAGCDALIEEYGRLLTATGQYAEAVTVLRPYVENRRDPPDGPAGTTRTSPVVSDLAAAYLATHRPQQAKHLLREELRRGGDAPSAAGDWMLLARACLATEDWTTARWCAERVTRLKPDDASAHLLHGFVCWKQGDLPSAKTSLERALAVEPSDPLVHCLLGQVLERTGDRAAAERHYRRARQIDPHYAWAERLLT